MRHFYNKDCMEGMKEFPDKYFDLAIPDPPYFELKDNFYGADVSNTGAKRTKFKSQNWRLPNKDYFNELFRVSKNQIIWGANHFGNFKSSSCWLIWDKLNSDSTYADAELAFTSFDSATKIFRYLWNGFLQQNMKQKEKRIHPNQKPISLYRWLLKNYAKEGDIILDTHVGSASSLIACEMMGFDYVGFEIDEDYYEDAMKRLENFRKQIPLDFKLANREAAGKAAVNKQMELLK